MSDAASTAKRAARRWARAARGLGAAADAAGSARRCRCRAWMVDAIAPQPGHRSSSSAPAPATTGFLAAELIQPGGTLISSDFAPEMLYRRASGAPRSSGIKQRALPADRRRVRSTCRPRRSTACSCRWVYMLMDDAEARCARRGGCCGPAGASRWRPGPRPTRTRGRRCRWASSSSAGTSSGPSRARRAQFAWARAGTIEEHLDNAGFTEYEVDTVDFAYVYPSVDEWIAVGRDCSMMMRTALERLGPAERDDTIEAIREAALPYVTEDGSVVAPARSWVAAATA